MYASRVCVCAMSVYDGYIHIYIYMFCLHVCTPFGAKWCNAIRWDTCVHVCEHRDASLVAFVHAVYWQICV